MTSELLTDILAKHGDCERTGDTFAVPGAMAVTLFAALASEPLIVERISSITLDPKLVIVETSRSERYFFAYEDVRALRIHRG
jgi:hypothetical protein